MIKATRKSSSPAGGKSILTSAIKQTTNGDVAYGAHTTSSGLMALAIGGSPTSTAASNTAIGPAAYATSNHSIALGYESAVTGNRAVTTGAVSTATSQGSVAANSSSYVSGDRALALSGTLTGALAQDTQTNTQAAGDDSIGFWYIGPDLRCECYSGSSDNDALAVGHGATASAESTLALGTDADSGGTEAIS